MGFNKALCNQQVCIYRDSVDDALAAGWKCADLCHGCVVGGNMHDDLLMVHNLLSVFVNQFLVR